MNATIVSGAAAASNSTAVDEDDDDLLHTVLMQCRKIGATEAKTLESDVRIMVILNSDAAILPRIEGRNSSAAAASISSSPSFSSRLLPDIIVVTFSEFALAVADEYRRHLAQLRSTRHHRPISISTEPTIVIEDVAGQYASEVKVFTMLAIDTLAVSKEKRNAPMTNSKVKVTQSNPSNFRNTYSRVNFDHARRCSPYTTDVKLAGLMPIALPDPLSSRGIFPPLNPSRTAAAAVSDVSRQKSRGISEKKVQYCEVCEIMIIVPRDEVRLQMDGWMD